MEDALVQCRGCSLTVWQFSLNPCFNGRCTRTNRQGMTNNELIVLILVLMEDALVQ